MSASLAFDPNTASAEALLERYPDLGLFAAEDLVAWRTEHGPFESVAQLLALGINAELAAQLVADIGGPPPAAPAEVVTVVPDAELEASPPPPTPPPTPPPPAPTPPPVPPVVEAAPSIHPSIHPIEEDVTSPVLVAPIEAMIEAQPVSPSPPPPPPHDSHEAKTPNEPSASTPPPPPRRRVPTFVFTVLAMVVSALLAGFVALRREAQQVRAPVAALSAEVHAIHANQEDASAKQRDTTARLEDTRGRLEKQEEVLAKTVERVNAVEARQETAEHEAKEQADRDAKRTAALGNRVGRVEKKVEEVYSIAQALEIIDRSQKGPVVPAAAQSAPKPSGAPEPARPPPHSAH